ncbi:Uncharacterised protein [Yersinia enterocolitica]|nr:Uncharacterised protein [Yersinia enterocolitica]
MAALQIHKRSNAIVTEYRLKFYSGGGGDNIDIIPGQPNMLPGTIKIFNRIKMGGNTIFHHWVSINIMLFLW